VANPEDRTLPSEKQDATRERSGPTTRLTRSEPAIFTTPSSDEVLVRGLLTIRTQHPKSTEVARTIEIHCVILSSR
jgi:hypothetical protein